MILVDTLAIFQVQCVALELEFVAAGGGSPWLWGMGGMAYCREATLWLYAGIGSPPHWEISWPTIDVAMNIREGVRAEL